MSRHACLDIKFGFTHAITILTEGSVLVISSSLRLPICNHTTYKSRGILSRLNVGFFSLSYCRRKDVSIHHVQSFSVRVHRRDK